MAKGNIAVLAQILGRIEDFPTGQEQIIVFGHTALPSSVQ
jgi:hypothetical protein